MELKVWIKTVSGEDLPISGGTGQSIEDPIVINVDKGEDGVAIEYRVIRFIHQFSGETWRLKKQALMQRGDKYIDKMSIVSGSDQENYINYYFDITQFYLKGYL